MRFHFENIVTVLFFVVSLLILAPACSSVSHALSQPGSAEDAGPSVLVNP